MGFLRRLFGRKNEAEVSPGGSTIYRYGELPDSELQLPDETGRYLEEIEAHFAAIFPGRESFVLYELVSDAVRIDVHVMKPTAEMPFYVVFTTGMSDKAMNVPRDIPSKDRENLALAELYMFLPGDWDLGDAGRPPKDISSARLWPILFMKFLARFPHLYNTWLASGHTIPNGEDYDPLADDTAMSGVVLSGGSGPMSRMTAKDGRVIQFYHVMPCYKEEIEYKLKYGMDSLLKLFQENEVSPVLDPQRSNLCPDFKELLD